MAFTVRFGLLTLNVVALVEEIHSECASVYMCACNYAHEMYSDSFHIHLCIVIYVRASTCM